MAATPSVPSLNAPTPPRLEVVQIAVGLIDPAPWNVNKVSPEMMWKLRSYIEREGLVQPLIVRPVGGRFEMVGGHHRLQILRDDMHWPEVPCVVVNVDERRAKIMSVNLNELSGDPVPHLMAALVHDLSRDTSLEDLSTILPYSENELADFEELLRLPDGLAAFVEEQVEKEKREAPTVLTFVVERAEPVEAAVKHVMDGLDGKNRRGRALTALAEAYLIAKGLPVPEPAANPGSAAERPASSNE